MHLRRNFVWTLDLSDRELKTIIKILREEDLDDDEQGLADKLSDTLSENASRLEHISAGRSRGRIKRTPEE